MTTARAAIRNRKAVVIGDADLCFHSPRGLDCTWDMEQVSAVEAKRRGAMPCSHCFDGVRAMNTTFPYME